MRRPLSIGVSILVALFAAQACTVSQTEAPSLTGPSEFALSVAITASPDSISRDGGSQSSITVVVRDADAKPVANQVVRLDLAIDGSVLYPFGTLSARTVVTGSDGTVRAVYTAPSAPAAGVAASAVTVSVVATPTGTNAQVIRSEAVDIRLVPLGVIQPSGPLPVPAFTVSSSPIAASPVQFNGSTSCGGPVAANGACPASSPRITSYSWNFGDGGTATGAIASHSFAVQRTYSVTLTVTNDIGVSASITQAVNVGAGVLPTGGFTVSPTPVNVGVTTYFSAETINPGPGHTIVQFSWDFGDGGHGSGFNPTHVYTTAGTYAVLLEVVDEAGQAAAFPLSLTVGTGKPTAVLTINKTGSTSILADGSGSTAVGSATIVDFNFTWGDSTPNTTGPSAVVPHGYPALVPPATSQSFDVRLTVTDSLGRTGTTTQRVTLP